MLISLSNVVDRACVVVMSEWVQVPWIGKMPPLQATYSDGRATKREATTGDIIIELVLVSDHISAGFPSVHRVIGFRVVEPTICYNEFDYKNNGTSYSLFFCPAYNQSDSMNNCCGPSNRERCCTYSEKKWVMFATHSGIPCIHIFRWIIKHFWLKQMTHLSILTEFSTGLNDVCDRVSAYRRSLELVTWKLKNIWFVYICFR